MLGWAPAANGLMGRARLPKLSVEEFMGDRSQRNAKITAATKSSGDDIIDEEAYEKTILQVQRGVLQGPYDSFEAVPFDSVA